MKLRVWPPPSVPHVQIGHLRRPSLTAPGLPRPTGQVITDSSQKIYQYWTDGSLRALRVKG